ncbi:MAG: sulfatase-like hydrolase/transferase [Planctomycetes bacterium]|nr:sulfatase-like hydrolase/transferase [Planctomycetota bacterium]
MSTQPNILLVMTDQQRWDSLGSHGFAAAHTPNLDRLAATGARFDACYINNPICTPSRASLFTGKHLPDHGVQRLYDVLPEDEVLFTRHLQELGYTTALFGKLHVSAVDYEHYQRHPNDGFDIFESCMEPSLRMDAPLQAYAQWLQKNHPEFHARMVREKRGVLHHPQEVHMTRGAADRTIDFIENQPQDKPWFCHLSIFDPHNPYEDYPLEMEDLVDAKAIPDPLPPDEAVKSGPADLKREHHHSYLGDFENISLEQLRKIRYGYHASIAFADQEFGRVFDALERKGQAGNTLVIFTSDHGDMLGDHGLMVKGAFFYDACTRVPLILNMPDTVPEGIVTSALVQIHDLAATVLRAAGMDPERIKAIMPDSRDILPLACGKAQRVHTEAICCYRNSGLSAEPRSSGNPYWDPEIHATMFRDERYKLNLWHTGEEPGAPSGPALRHAGRPPGGEGSLLGSGSRGAPLKTEQKYAALAG